MPSLPDIPGKNLVTGTGHRAGKVAAGAGLAMIAVGGYVARRLVRRGRRDEGDSANADPIAEIPTAPPRAENEATTRAEKPPPAPKPPHPDPPRPKPPKPEPPAPEPRAEAPPAKPEAEPGDRSKDEDPHHTLNNPVGEPDPTEWPDPYEKRDDPRDPGDPDAHAPANAESTSEPHPSQDPEAGDRATPPQRDKLDE